MGPEAEFEEYDRNGSWAQIYHKIRMEASQLHDGYSMKDCRNPGFRGRNRYRDVSPYDHSRVVLERGDVDYINANLVVAPEANRKYILTQGPLPHTASHFWLMVWEQNSAAVLMLNRLVESGRIKCHQYFPMGEDCEDEDEMIFEDVGLRVKYLFEEDANYYIIRHIEIEDLESGETKEVLQFHYTTWPDMDVPKSPEHFLDFLFDVRRSGALDQDVGPPIIHCSAGIGRSGTFCLVDTCLVLIEANRDPNTVDVINILMEMRKYRMGLIQTPDQLRFSYMAVIEGSKRVLSSSPDSGIADMSPQPSITPESLGAQANICTLSHNATEGGNPRENGTVEAPDEEFEKLIDEDDMMEEFDKDSLRKEGVEIRRRKRSERVKNTADQIARMKQKQQESEKWQGRRIKLKPYIVGVGLSLAVLLGGYFLYSYYLT